MNHRISPREDLILQTSLSVADDAYSLGSTFTLQDRVEAIEQSSEEFYQMVSKRWRCTKGKMFPRSRREQGVGRISLAQNVHKIFRLIATHIN